VGGVPKVLQYRYFGLRWASLVIA